MLPISPCGHNNPEGARFCATCGVALVVSCGACGAPLQGDAHFCSRCGAPVSPSDAHGLPPREAAEPVEELRQLTVLFCDLVGSTALADRVDPETLRDLLDDYHRVCTGVIEEHGGYVAQYLGDGVLAYFGYPSAYEDSAERAVVAGLQIQRRLDARNVERSGPALGELLARVGVHTGRTVVGSVGEGSRRETLAVGNATNVAARVQAMAEPRTVWITSETQNLVADVFEFAPQGTHPVKGLAEPVTVFRALRHLGAVAHRRSATPFVGRRQALETIERCWRSASKGEGQLVLLMGEPGIGKSRLVEHVKSVVADDGHVWTEGVSSQHLLHTPFAVAADIIARSNGWTPETTNEQKLERLETAVELAGLDVAEGVPLLAAILGVDAGGRFPSLLLSADERRRRTIATIASWFLQLAGLKPIILVIEDLHWTDPSTLEALTLLSQQVSSAPILILLTARPEFRITWPMRSYHSVVTLTRLERSEVDELVASMLSSGVGHEIAEAIADRSDGVPLFAEELARGVEGPGDAVVAEIPATLQDSLSARLDRLGTAREVVQVASVAGREFSYALLRRISPIPDAEIEAAVERIVDADLFQASGVPPIATYQFRHALIQQAAYDSMLRKRRQELHVQVAALLKESGGALPEVLAAHWAAAGEPDQAARAWRSAGSRALAAGAYHESIAHHRHAIECLAELEESPERARRELELTVRLSGATGMAEGFTSAKLDKINERARALSEQVGDDRERANVLMSVWTNALNRLDIRNSLALSDQMEQLALRSGEAELLSWAHAAKAGTLLNTPELEQARDYAARSAAFDPGSSSRNLLRHHSRPQALLYWALSSVHLGELDRARALAEELVAFVEASDEPGAIANGVFSAGTIGVWLRDFDWVLRLAERVLEVGQGMQFFEAGSRLWRGWALAMNGETREGLALLEPAVHEIAGAGMLLGRVQYLCQLAEAKLVAGEHESALEIVESALVVGPEDHPQRSEAHHLRAKLRLASGADDARVAASFELAIEHARRSHSKLVEVRTAVSFASALSEWGRADEARGMLDPIVGSIREGFDEVDFKLAIQLQRSLAGETGS